VLAPRQAGPLGVEDTGACSHPPKGPREIGPQNGLPPAGSTSVRRTPEPTWFTPRRRRSSIAPALPNIGEARTVGGRRATGDLRASRPGTALASFAGQRLRRE
jgi:hypothetical protein